MSQYGFYFDMTRCFGCHTCQVACKDRLGLQTAGARPRRVRTFEAGAYPNTVMYHASVSCNHCESPACVANCPTGAMFKSEDGPVLHDDAVCIGCKTCIASCPYEAPQYDTDNDLIIKCDSCMALREAGMNPVCVDACVARALDFGPVDELKAKYGDGLVSDVACLPSSDITTPGLFVKAHEASASADFNEVLL